MFSPRTCSWRRPATTLTLADLSRYPRTRCTGTCRRENTPRRATASTRAAPTRQARRAAAPSAFPSFRPTDFPAASREPPTKSAPPKLVEKPVGLIRFVEDRKGHDRRYAVDTAKLRSLGWAPEHDFFSALERTVRWYQENRWWWEPIYAGPFQDYYQRQYGERLAR